MRETRGDKDVILLAVPHPLDHRRTRWEKKKYMAMGGRTLKGPSPKGESRFSQIAGGGKKSKHK